MESFRLRKLLFFYLSLLSATVALVWITLDQGKLLEERRFLKLSASVHAAPSSSERDIPAKAERAQSNAHFGNAAATLFLQVATILLVCWLCRKWARCLGQPTVIGEMVAGLILGPSLLGLFWPKAFAFLFSAPSLINLQLLSQLGLILFMFTVGLEMDLREIRRRADQAVIISHASIVIPYLLGVILAFFLFDRLAPPHISFLAFALFMGIAMSITAFPVLARILQEKGLSHSPLGKLALTCAAADDATAWCLLAIVIALIQGGTPLNGILLAGALLLDVWVMLRLVRPLVSRWFRSNPSKLNPSQITLIFALLFLSAFVTEWIGIHAIFGAFLAGVALTDHATLRRQLSQKIHQLSLVLLLPIFFALTGLRTQISLLGSFGLWLICFLILGVAILGKFGGTVFAARFVGQSWHDSCVLGTLMNTRGLMELVVLNLGYELGILSPAIFSMMVLMALVTTFMTGPALSIIELTQKLWRPFLEARASPKTDVTA